MSDPIQTRPVAAAAPRAGVSLIFMAMVAVFAALGVALAIGRGGTIGVFAFVFVGWIISLCLHEWGHAATAWAGGDRSVAERGYLTLNPLHYANPLMSIALPLLILAIGGIGFPGGAVYVNNAALRTPLWRAAVSAAGPAMNLVCLIAIGLVMRFVTLSEAFAGALAFLGLLQATALILNLLPIPGLDGFGVLQTLFPERERDALMPIARAIGLVFLVTLYMAPQLFQPIWDVALKLCGVAGIPTFDIATGYALFQFWDTSP